jgi:hypothetical protein
VTTDRSRYANEVDTAHVGRRVSVRRWVEEPDATAGPGAGEPRRRPSDVVGELVAADDRTFTVRRRDGREVVVDRAAVLGSRLLPPRVERPRRPRPPTS